MIADVPPPPSYVCVKAEDVKVGATYVILAGAPQQVEAIIANGDVAKTWKVDADATSNDVRFVRLTASINVPYREIGGLIYSAQRRRLAVTMTTDPLICEAEEK
ncbi:MAG: hypothetical protein AB7E24_21445 [Novosphingobium sp.]